MKIPLILVLLLQAILSAACTENKDLWNYDKVLYTSRASFVNLCENAGGSLENANERTMRCSSLGGTKADVYASVENDRIYSFGMTWAEFSYGAAMHFMLKDILGEEDTTAEESGCTVSRWVKPSDTGLVYETRLCPESSSGVIVSDPN